MMRHALQLLAVAACAIAIPELAQAMGPTSAPLKNQGVQTAAVDPPVVAAPRTHHRSKRRH